MYDDIGVVQIDPINVLARAHHQVFASRLGPYDRAALDRWLWQSGEVYEGWIHVDATAQVDLWPLLAHRRAATLPWRAVRSVMDHRPEYLQLVLDEVAERGALTAAQLRDPGDRLGSWGTRSMGRAALDYHHLRGDLAISSRDDRMAAWFDLAERVIPDRWRQAEVPPPQQAETALLRRALQHMGLGTATDLADHHRQHIPTARGLLAAMARANQITEVAVEGWKGPVYADPDLVIPRRIQASALINPFDPLIWNRARTARLFDLDYRIEIYVPAARRVHGYYVLPFLLGEHLVARVDLKLDRATRRLVVRQASAQPGHAPAAIAWPLRAELHTWACWLGAQTVVITDDGPLGSALARTGVPA
ncbi:MAG TPA: crosslink repair DNA glycosylase YcaQ family protein [Euzebya sp.]|nr:crosslink repair DNA glycosylase YcaQ family protein [Euzebya sp.]